VNIFDEAEAKYWAKRFGCTRAQLEAAVMKVGVTTNERGKGTEGEIGFDSPMLFHVAAF
jgi:hypothetical protein